jgi:RHS repeat-associated protein
VEIVESDNGSTTSDAKFIWCGFALCEVRDSGGSILKRYFHEGMQDSGTELFYTRDHLGSVRELIDGSNVVRARYDYDAWGRRTKVSGDKDADTGFTGHYQHAASGLILTPFRAYDSNLGRWISEDPVGFELGVNLYGYVDNRPLFYVDPLGLWSYAAEYGTTGDGLSTAMMSIEVRVDNVFNDIAGHDATVTYTTNGKHKTDSKHYDGDAVDLRTRDLTADKRKDAEQRLKDDLPSDYKVIDEGDHIHVEFAPQPKPKPKRGNRC